MRSLSAEMTTSSATVLREKYCRNKRKFRQDPPPFTSQRSADENNCGGSNAVSSECERWTPEPRSVVVVPSKSSMVDSSCRKGSDGGNNSVTSKSESSGSLHQDQVKLMRFRSEQARVAQAMGAGWDALCDEAVDGNNKAPEEDDDFYELQEADWDDCTESELEDLLVKSLGSLYNEAISKIVSFGHRKEEVLRAVLKHGRCYGGKDAVANIVENSLAYLTRKKDNATDASDDSFSDLKELYKYSLAEMVGLLREVRPWLSKGDAMWCLLMCDMNVPLACVMDDSTLVTNKDPFPGLPANQPDLSRLGSSSSPTPAPLCASTLPTDPPRNSSNSRCMPPPTDADVSSPSSSIPISPSLLPKSSSPPPSVSTPDVSLLTLLDSIPHSPSREPSDETSSNFEEPTSDGGTPDVTNIVAVHDCLRSDADDHDDDEDEVEEGLANSAVMPTIASLKLDDRVDEEQGCSTESDKNENPCSSTICKPPRATAGPSQIMNALTEIKEADGLEFLESRTRTSDSIQGEGDLCELHTTKDCTVSSSEKKPWDSASTLGNSETDVTSQDESVDVGREATVSDLEPRETTISSVKFGTVDERAVTAATERFSSRTASSEPESPSCLDEAVITRETVQAFLQAAQKTDAECLIKETSLFAAPVCLSKETSVPGTGQLEDQKDEMIMKLVHRSKDLEIQLQERTEWAKQKVMQAARRLSNDLQELKALRFEREEALRLKKDKQAVDESTMKKVTDLENALRKTKTQLDEANKSVKRLDTENAEVRAEMQAAKLSAAEAQSSCQEFAKRERKSIKRAQAWEKQKAKLQEELSEEKRKIVALQQQIVAARERQQQAEVRWRQEEKAKEDSLLRAEHERRAREQAETAAKKREESLRRKAESNYQRHREDFQRLESEIAQFRTSAEAAQLATSRWGPGVAVSPQMMELSSFQALKESNNRLAREIAELQDMAQRDVHRERECVMCMCEEMSVVFLPCAHQVVCVKCNDLHEKQGMRDCPSCRTPIKQRIRIYGVSM